MEITIIFLSYNCFYYIFFVLCFLQLLLYALFNNVHVVNINFILTEIASEGLKFRVFEVSLADLQSDQDAERSFRKFRLIAEDVQGRNVLTNFHGMDLTTDKLRSMVKKWQTLIEANVDVKTTDGYLLRVFCIGFTNKDQLSTRKTCYAQHAQVGAQLCVPLIARSSVFVTVFTVMKRDVAYINAVTYHTTYV